MADTTWTLATATVDYASFQPPIKPTDAELAKFYQENEFRYEIPARIAAACLDFSAADYTGQVKGAADEKVRLDKAKRMAAKAASDVAYALYESKVTPGPELDAFLAARKLAPKPLAPFAAEAGPAELGGSPGCRPGRGRPRQPAVLLRGPADPDRRRHPPVAGLAAGAQAAARRGQGQGRRRLCRERAAQALRRPRPDPARLPGGADQGGGRLRQGGRRRRQRPTASRSR